jgi:AcrR family transcriptional regulator
MSPRKAATAVREQLSRDAVVRTALALADGEGMEAVSIRRVAAELGVTPMALYWPFANKNELLAAMGDSRYDGLRVELDPAQPWPVRLRSIVEQLLALVRQHPGAVALVPARILHTDNGRAVTETTLGVLREGGYDLEASVAIARQLLTSVIGLVAEGDDAERIGMLPEVWDEHKRAKRAALLTLPADRYPLLVASAQEQIDWGCDDDTTARAVDVLIAGIEALAPSRTP